MSERPPVITVRKATPPFRKIIDRAKYDASPGAYEVWRDPLDHDADGKKGGSVAQVPSDDLDAARADYQAALEKKPYHGWDVATLRAKVAAHEAEKVK